MRRTCTNCNQLSSYGGGSWGVDCKKIGRIKDVEPFEFVWQENECPFFDPKLVDLKLIEDLKHSPLIGPSMRTFTQVPSASHFWTGRGSAMLELSDNDLPSFESDDKYKTYDFSNHIFADLLVPCKPRNPIVFWLSESNQAGAKHYIVSSHILSHHVVRLGRPYNYDQVLMALAEALYFERIRLECPWFAKNYHNKHKREITNLSIECSYVYGMAKQKTLKGEQSD